MVRQLREHVWWIDLVGVNAYLVDDGGTLTLVDAGSPWDRRAIEWAVTSVAGSISDVDRVLLTHYDIDHVGALHRIDALDATVYIGEADLPYLTGEAKPSWRGKKGAFQRALGWLSKPPSLPVEPVADGDEIGSFRAYHAPGHTPGHTVFASEELSVALLGDVVRETDGAYAVPPRIICSDHDQTKASVSKMAEELPEFEAGCQGHGVPFKEHGGDRLAGCADTFGRMRVSP